MVSHDDSRVVGAHNNEWRIVESVFAIDVDSLADEFLALAQIAVSTGQQEFIKLVALVERVLVAQHAALDHLALLAQLPL